MKRKTDRGRMKFRAFMVCVLSFLVVTGSACFLNREQEKEEKLKAVYAAESTVSRVKSQLVLCNCWPLCRLRTGF